MLERTIHVDFGPRSYDVVIGSGVLTTVGARVGRVLGDRVKRCVVVRDARLPMERMLAVRESCEQASILTTEIEFGATETSKSLASLERLCEAIARMKLERCDAVVALGGGVVGDLAGFAGATYKRGVAVIQCPTTLLSMVDASVGGKTGVNLLVPARDGARTRLLKNYVGAFHQPRLVLADVDTLDTLPEREFRAGLGECLKHGMLGADLGDGELWSWTVANRDKLLAKDPGTLVELIARNVALKVRVVAGDEFETAPDDVGGRALLNLGHTFGHAIETLDADHPDYDLDRPALKHGEAVALGLCAAAACAELAGVAQVGILPHVREAVAAFGLRTNVGGLPQGSEILERMRADKKAIGGSMRLILPTRMGSARVVRDVGDSVVVRAIDAIRAETT